MPGHVRALHFKIASHQTCLYRRLKRFASMASVRVSVNKDPTLADEVFQLKIAGLKPNHKITLHSSIHLPNSSIFESLAHYVADNRGCISLDHHKSQGGSFTGLEPMGPLSFMEPSPLNERKYERFTIKDPTKPFKIDFRVVDNFIPSVTDPSIRNRFEMAPNLSITRLYMLPGVKEILVWHGRVRATLYLPPGKGPFPGVISMSGGYPGAMKHKAAILASHGFAALALKYYGEDDLTDEFFDVDMDYIEEAVVFMVNHKAVDRKRGVGIVANCYGGTIGLSAASVFPKGLIRCVATTNSWIFPGGNFTYKGELVDVEMPAQWVASTSDGVVTMNINIQDGTLEENTEKSFYKQHDISYLHIFGENDGYLQTRKLASLTKSLYEKANHPDYSIYFYGGAGHLIEHSFYPFTSVVWTFEVPQCCGGEQPSHSIAQNDSWPKILAFLREKLGTVTSKL